MGRLWLHPTKDGSGSTKHNKKIKKSHSGSTWFRLRNLKFTLLQGHCGPGEVSFPCTYVLQVLIHSYVEYYRYSIILGCRSGCIRPILSGSIIFKLDTTVNQCAIGVKLSHTSCTDMSLVILTENGNVF